MEQTLTKSFGMPEVSFGALVSDWETHNVDPGTVLCCVEIRKVSNISTSNATFDCRLAVKLFWTVEAKKEELEPSLYFPNREETKEDYTDDYSEYVFNDENAGILCKRAYEWEQYCTFSTPVWTRSRQFPFDLQHLNIDFGLGSVEEDNEYTFIVHSIYFDGDVLQSPEWRLLDKPILTSHGNSDYTLALRVQRTGTRSYVWDYVLPAFLLGWFVWLSFLANVEDVATRGGFGFTLLLAMVVLQQQATGLLPNGARISQLGILMTVNTFILMYGILASVVPLAMQRLNSTCVWWNAEAWNTAFLYIFLFAAPVALIGWIVANAQHMSKRPVHKRPRGVGREYWARFLNETDTDDPNRGDFHPNFTWKPFDALTGVRVDN